MTQTPKTLLVAVAAFALFATPALSAPPADAAPPAPATAQKAAFEQDRQSILAMAGDYRVVFNFQETVAFEPDYELLPPKRSGGFEAVRVIEDSGDRIVLQHLLVVTVPDGEDSDTDKTIVIKHWRQDWVWQPRTVLTYDGESRWIMADVPAAEAKGAWSQTVWQTDDSPRYGGVGRWNYADGVARWTSGETRRPLARRDAVRHPVYGWYVGTNRHALTPTGWVHEQDNAKIGRRDGRTVTYVHEVVLNTYRRGESFDVKAADDYWAATRDYWAAVRGEWAGVIARNGGVSVTEEPANGSVTGPRLMGLADEIVEGRTTQAAAIQSARKVIAEGATAPR